VREREPDMIARLVFLLNRGALRHLMHFVARPPGIRRRREVFVRLPAPAGSSCPPLPLMWWRMSALQPAHLRRSR
jgi:hypothetical protein